MKQEPTKHWLQIQRENALFLQELKRNAQAKVYQGQPMPPPRANYDAPGCLIRSIHDECVLSDQREPRHDA